MLNHLIAPTVLKFQAAGKFMLFGEYLVLQGADCLAIPLKYGQTLEVTEGNFGFSWKSSSKGLPWFEAKFDENLQLISSSDSKTAEVLAHLLREIKMNKAHLFHESLVFQAEADFDLQWGLGSSSTLISLLAQWSEMNPYELLKESFGGSGYDIACASADTPICYKIKGNEHRPVRLSPAVSNKIIFVYSGNKQSSKNEIKRFENLSFSTEDIEAMNKLIARSLSSSHIEEFEACMNESEKLLSGILALEPLKTTHFQDYPYSIKSMGAWGGDFFMASFRDEVEARNYFKDRGYLVQFTYTDIIKS